MNLQTIARPIEPDSYFLSRTSAEYERLRVQAAIWQEATERVLAKSGLTRAACPASTQALVPAT